MAKKTPTVTKNDSKPLPSRAMNTIASMIANGGKTPAKGTPKKGC